MKNLFVRVLPFFLLCALCCGSAANKPLAESSANGDYERFGSQLADDINRGQAGLVVDAMDFQVLAWRAIKGLDMNESDRSQFVKGFVESSRASLLKQMNVWKKARFIRVSTVSNEKRVLIRVVSAQGALNFLDFVCALKSDGSLKAVDCYPFLTAELMSETSRRALLPILAEKDRSFIERLTLGEGAYVRSFPTIVAAGNSLQSGDAKSALSSLESLPADVKASPFVRLLRLQAAQLADNKAYLRVIEEWEKAAPNDPALDLVSVDGYFLRKDYVKAAACMERIQLRVGPDGYLEYLRGVALSMTSDREGMRAALRHAISVEPELTKSYDFWFAIELKDKNWTAMVEALSLFDTNFPKADIWNGIKNDAKWLDFRQSQECKDWLAKRAARRPTGN